MNAKKTTGEYPDWPLACSLVPVEQVRVLVLRYVVSMMAKHLESIAPVFDRTVSVDERRAWRKPVRQLRKVAESLGELNAKAFGPHEPAKPKARRTAESRAIRTTEKKIDRRGAPRPAV